MSSDLRKLGRDLVWFPVLIGAGVPAFVLRLSGTHLEPEVMALFMGLGIVGGAFLLSWAAEVAQLDVSASFALAVLALIAVLPEYAIEAVLAWDAGASWELAPGTITDKMDLVAANVTGANRLLIGLGWSAVILIYWARRRQTLDFRGYLGPEMAMLLVATALTLLIFIMGQVHFVLAVVLIALYLLYLWHSSRQEAEEPELVGPALTIGSLPPWRRRAAVLGLGAYAAAVILVAAEPFVDALVETGKELGIDEFILIQWVAPLASESPEIIVAVLFALRANPVAGLSTLISAEVSQLTLLIGSMVMIFSISAGDVLSFPLSDRQLAEFLLLTVVSTFAIFLLAPRQVTWSAGALILGLFIIHLFFVTPFQRHVFSAIYFALTVGLVAVNPARLRYLFRPPMPEPHAGPDQPSEGD